MATTLAQQKAVAIAPKFTAFASIIGSVTVAFLILKRAPKKTTYHRLVLGMSIVDLLASVAWFFTTWPIPRGTELAFY
jgi:phosphate/sulfate permease